MATERGAALPEPGLPSPPGCEPPEEVEPAAPTRPSGAGPLPAAGLWLVGIGADGPASLGAEARAMVAAADLLCGGERHLAWFADHPAERLVLRTDAAGAAQRIVGEARQRRVVVIASGDPLFYGIGARLAERLAQLRQSGPAAAAPRFIVIPHVSSVQLAFARLGLPWQDAGVVSAHGRSLARVLPAARVHPRLAVLTDPQNSPGVVAQALLAAGLPDCEAAVLENLGAPEERIVRGRLSELPGQQFAPLNLLVLLRDRPLPRPRFGLPDDAYAHERGMITKREVRAVALARLALAGDETVWDIGAGCGAVAIEAAALLPEGLVYAVERNPEQIGLLRQNVARHAPGWVQVVQGEAPAALAPLPTPQAVFLGGSGGHLHAILNVVEHALAPGGRLVLNLATLEHLQAVLARLRPPAWAADLTLLSAARGSEVAGLTRLAALNPVFVVAACRLGKPSPHPSTAGEAPWVGPDRPLAWETETAGRETSSPGALQEAPDA